MALHAGLLLGFQSHSLGRCVWFEASQLLSGLQPFFIGLDIRNYGASSAQSCFGHLKFSNIHTNIRIFCFCEKWHWNIWQFLELLLAFVVFFFCALECLFIR